MECDFMFLEQFRWFAQTTTSQQTRYKSHTEITTRTKTFDKKHQYKNIITHTRMTNTIITINMILNKRSHFTKKNPQTEIQQ